MGELKDPWQAGLFETSPHCVEDEHILKHSAPS